MRPFDHERLHVYRAAVDFLGWTNELVMRSRRLHPVLRDQFLRSATSIALNIAEGSGEYSRRDKARFYRIARRSATETAAMLDILAALDHVSQEQTAAPKAQLSEIAAMLTALTRNLETTTGPQPTPSPPAPHHRARDNAQVQPMPAPQPKKHALNDSERSKN